MQARGDRELSEEDLSHGYKEIRDFSFEPGNQKEPPVQIKVPPQIQIVET
jgi:hypothetical protein